MIRLVSLGLIVAAYVVACVLSPHGFWMTNLPRVEKIAELPAEALPKNIEYQIRFEALQIPVRRRDLPYAPSKPALGYSYRNFETLKLPFAAYEANGFVIYSESRKFLQVIPLTDETRQAITKALGRDPTAGYRFAWWKYSWGWLFAAALGIWLIFQYRHEYLMRRLRARELEAEWEQSQAG